MSDNGVLVQKQFEECHSCQKRVYAKQRMIEEDDDDDEPYISNIRMKNREKQPVNLFCDALDNNQLVKDRWQSAN